MKSLNRTLSLVLVLVMVLGLFGIAGAAFTDQAEVQYDEAVNVMAGIGAINGYEDGSFNPAGSITREEAAKLVVYSVLGKSLAEKLTVSATGFTDVDADRWSAPYIAYLVGQGVINGMGDGTFAPTESVTGYQMAKMMLVAAGYGAKGEFTGAGWELAVAVAGNKAGVFTGAAGVDYTKPATREEATLYAFNGIINVPMVAYDKLYERYDTLTQLPYTNLVGSTAATRQIAEEVYTKLSVDEAGADAFGRIAKVWYYGPAETPEYVIASTAAVANYTIVVNNPVKQNAGDLAHWLATANKKLDATSADIVVNNVADDIGTYKPQVGDVIEVYCDSNVPTDVENIVVTRYQLTQLSVAKAPAGTKDANGNTVTYILSGLGIASTYDTVFPGYNAATYVKDAIVAVAVDTGDSNKVLASYVPELKTGAIKAITNNVSVTLDASTYYNNGAGFSNPESINSGNVDWKTGSYGVFLDKNGFALGITKISGTAALTDVYYVNYVYTENVTAYGQNATKAYAQVVDLDGTITVLEVGFDAGETGLTEAVDADDGWYTKDGNKYESFAGTQQNDSTYYKINATVGELASFTQNATTKLYIPTEYETNATYHVAYDGSATLTNKHTKTGALFSSAAAYLTAETEYVVITKDGALAKATVLTGGVTITSQPIAVIATKDALNNYVAKYVVVDLAGDYDGVQTYDDFFYVPKASTTVNGPGTYAVTAYNAKGEKSVITATSAGADLTFYTYAKNTDGNYVLTPVSTDRADALTPNGSATVWAADKNTGFAYDEVFGGMYGTAITFYGDLQDIPAAGAVVVDLRDTTASGQYTGTVSSLSDIVMAAGTIKSGTTPYVVTFDSYITSTGIAIIFVTDIA